MKGIWKVIIIAVTILLLFTAASYATEPVVINEGTKMPKPIAPVYRFTYLNVTVFGQRFSIIAYSVGDPSPFPINLIGPGMILYDNVYLYVLASKPSPLAFGVSNPSVSGYMFNRSGNGTVMQIMPEYSPSVRIYDGLTDINFNYWINPPNSYYANGSLRPYINMNMTCVYNVTFDIYTVLGPFYGTGTEVHLSVILPVLFISES